MAYTRREILKHYLTKITERRLPGEQVILKLSGRLQDPMITRPPWDGIDLRQREFPPRKDRRKEKGN